MKAMALTGIREFSMIERSDPVISNEYDVLIKVICTGVCGSDLHMYKTGEIGGNKVEFPFIIGHEGSGIVVNTGPSVTRVKKGDLIAIEPAVTCGKCDQCLEGRQNTCRDMTFLGSPGESDGLLAEYIIMPESCCFPLPPGLEPQLGMFAEPLSIGIYSVGLAGDLDGKKIAIFGSGPIGLSVLLYARTIGVSRIFSTDLIDARLQLAKNAGAHWTGNPDQRDIIRPILEEEPGGIDVVYECCGKQEALDQAVEILKPGGKIVLVGIPEFDTWHVPVEKTRRKEISLFNVRRQNDCLQTAIDLIADKKVDVRPLITHEFPFSRTNEAFELVAAYRDGVMKARIEF